MILHASTRGKGDGRRTDIYRIDTFLCDGDAVYSLLNHNVVYEMNNKDIPADKINNEVARALDIKLATSFDFMPKVGVLYYGECHKTALGYECTEFDPLTNHNQFHEIWTPEMEAKACDVLDGWLTIRPQDDFDGVYWHNPEYKPNRRLWQLRAVCEVLGNA